ncbi:MAG: hypothetical protein JWL77_3316, partial [Chthonomonadaceae bacterium]|nr:hypothetical protein [Chthonomonadaceae bacterium]
MTSGNRDDFSPRVQQMAAQYVAEGGAPDLGSLFSDLRTELKTGPKIDLVSDPARTGEAEPIPLDPDRFMRTTDFDNWEQEAIASFLLAASVLVSFDPATLQPLTPQGHPEDSHTLLAIQGYSEMILSLTADGNQEPRWSLPDSIRRPALQYLHEKSLTQAAQQANSTHALRAHDPLQVCLGQAVIGKLPDLNQMRLADLMALRRVSDWMPRESFPWMPDSATLTLCIEREQLLTPFRAMIGRWDADGLYREYFQGRQEEMRRLRSYVDAAEAESVFESAARFVQRKVAKIFDLKQRLPLLIQGEGGVGKSTLLAKFILQHAAANDTSAFPFIYIDFDRPDIRISEPMTVVADACRQLDLQFPEEESRPFGAEENFQTLARDILAAFGGQNSLSTVSTTEAASALGSGARRDEREQLLNKFAALYARIDRDDLPFLLVLDTFEEVQYRSRDYVTALYELLQDLQRRIPNLRTVLAGRVSVTQFPTEEVVLTDLDEDAARGFLAANEINDRATADDIIRYVGRQPLSLVLAIDLLRRDPQGLRAVRAAGQPQHDRNIILQILAKFRKDWDNVAIQGRLFDRILGHLHDPRLQKIAHPGLVLRRITADLILKVLAGPCKLQLSELSEAEALFEELEREVALVKLAEPGALRVRTDLRRLILPLIIRDEPVTARRIQEGAVAYYAQQEGASARAEEIYHRLMLGESPRTLEAFWRDDLSEYLRSSLEELPPSAQAFVAVRINADLPDAVWAAAEQPDWERYTGRRASDLLQQGNAALALQILEERGGPTTGETLYLQALTLERLARTEEARSVALVALQVLPETAEYEKLRISTEAIARPAGAAQTLPTTTPTDKPPPGGAHYASAAFRRHGTGVRGLELSRQSLQFDGRFGRLFRTLPGAVHTDADL